MSAQLLHSAASRNSKTLCARDFRPAVRLRSRGRRGVMGRSLQQPISASTADWIELDDSFSQAIDPETGLMTIAGFGSLLSPTSARSTFPELRSFRRGVLPGWRRVFAHTCAIFYERGIARPETLEISSLSVEPCDRGTETHVALFEIAATDEAVAAFTRREHEFRFGGVQVRPLEPGGAAGVNGRPAVVCVRSSDEHYRATRCPPELWEEMYGRHGIDRLWRDDIFPCRAYLRHCVLAARKLGDDTHGNFLDTTYLGDRQTTVRQWLQRHPDILEELPPPSLIGRYSG